MICYDFQLINAIMFFGSMAITLFSVLSAKEQADRLKNSGFGTLASSIVSILITMLEKDNNVYLIAYTFAGCAIGALLGWYIIYRIVKKASNSKLTRIELLYTGLSGVKDEIQKEDKKEIYRILSGWNVDFEATLYKEIQNDKAGQTFHKSIFNWIKLTSDFYKLVLRSFSKKIENQSEDIYQPRVSVIIFGITNENNICGYHWISYSGERPEFKDVTFDKESNAFKIITKEIASPFIYAPDKNNGQVRMVQNNKGDYKTYLLIRINDFCVITVDWPSIVKDEDGFLELLKSSFQKSICPKIAEIIEGKEEEILKTKNLISLSNE